MPRLLAPLLLFAAGLSPLQAQRCPSGPVALVLAGGGAKGFAHVGVLHVLDSLGVRPDLVVGTSVGAIVGALYASGLSARQIDSLTRVLPLFEGGRFLASRAPHQWGGLHPAILWEQGRRGLALATGGLREYQTNATLNRLLLRANLRARGDFDRLTIPFRAIATNLRDRSPVVLRRGDLAQAVRASIAVPLVFAPERIGEEVYTDGSISANLPIAAARAAGAARVIAVDLKDPAAGDSLDLSSADAVASRLAGFLFSQPMDSLGPDDIYIRPDVRGVATLRFDPATRDRLLANGRAAADSSLRGATCLPRRPSPAIPPLPSRLTTWSVANGSKADGELVGRVLGLRQERGLEVEALDVQLGELAHIEAFRELWLGPTGAGDSVAFEAQVVRAAPRAAGLGIAYDYNLGGRLWAAGLDRVLLPGVEASGMLTLGEFRNDLTGILLTHLGIGRMTLMPLMSLQLRAEAIRQFVGTGENFQRLPTREASAHAGFEWTKLGAWRLRSTGGLVFWKTPEGAKVSTAGVFLRGQTEPGQVADAHGEAALTGEFRYGLVEAAIPLHRGRLTLEPGVRAAAGRGLPVQRTFEFGGSDGFPGLAIGERRGDRELVARLQSSFLVSGPLSFRLLLATGRSATGGALFDRSRWLVGARAGLGADTPIGPVSFEYGLATKGRKAAFVRVGRWF